MLISARDENAVLDEKLIDTISKAHTSVKDYLWLYPGDFAMVDTALEEVPAGWAFQFAEDIQLREAYDAIIKKELKLSDKKLQQHKQKTLNAYHEVKEGESETNLRRIIIFKQKRSIIPLSFMEINTNIFLVNFFKPHLTMATMPRMM